MRRTLLQMLHWRRESYHEGPHQVDTTENLTVEVNAVKNFLKKHKDTVLFVKIQILIMIKKLGF